MEGRPPTPPPESEASPTPLHAGSDAAALPAMAGSDLASPAGHGDGVALPRVRDFDATAAVGPEGLPGCAEALAALPYRPAPPGGPIFRGERPKPDPSGMPEITVTDPALLPGVPASGLPPEPLRGPPEVLGRIRDVFRRGARGERVRISFFGASHTGGELWTGRIRRILQGRWGDSGHGFVMPAALYDGDRASDVGLCRTDGWLSDWHTKANAHEDGLLGFAGMSVSSGNPADFGWVETTRTGERGSDVARFDVYVLGQPSGGTLLARVDGLEPFRIPTTAETAGLRLVRVRVADGAHRLTLSPAGDGEVRIFGVSMEREGSGVLVDAMGIRGREARDWLHWEPTMFGQGLRSLAPDMVVLAYGTNEAADQRYGMDEYRADLRAVLRMLRAAVPPEVPCILAGPSDRAWKLGAGRYAIWDRTAPVAAIQREVAPDFGCASWDWQQAMGGPGSMVGWHRADPKLGAGDLVHHTKAGYEWIADRFVAAVDDLEGRGDLP